MVYLFHVTVASHSSVHHACELGLHFKMSEPKLKLPLQWLQETAITIR